MGKKERGTIRVGTWAKNKVSEWGKRKLTIERKKKKKPQANCCLLERGKEVKARTNNRVSLKKPKLSRRSHGGESKGGEQRILDLVKGKSRASTRWHQ